MTAAAFRFTTMSVRVVVIVATSVVSAPRPTHAQTNDGADASPVVWMRDGTLARQVEIRRTTHGVPHILAENLRAAGFALGYVMVEDYGERVIRGLVQARGEMGRTFGRDEMDSDFENRLDHQRAVETYHLLDQGTRDMLDGFAAGVNHFIRVRRDEVPDWAEPIFVGWDVAARDIGGAGSAQSVLRRLQAQRDSAASSANGGATTRRMPEAPGTRTDASAGNGGDASQDNARGSDADVGSNAWALAPSRTRSRRAILLRNPHLSWTSGYYEAHVTVPGVLNFYGDFRIGGPFGIIGGFNERLGWSTTNNDPDTDEVYALDVDPERPDHYLFDGASIPVRRIPVTVEFRNGDGFGLETREVLRTPLGPVVERADGRIYVVRGAGDGEYRLGDQLLRMMRAQNLEQWKDAMRIRARTSSNFTYADADGNIFYIWNGSVPALPHGSGFDSIAVPARASSEVWNRLVPFDSLPMLLNPKGGYIHQENDPFHYTNLNQPLDSSRFPPYFSAPRLGLRSQHALELLHNNRRLSLEDVIELKHSMKMLLADRVKQDLVDAVRRANPTGDVAAAIELLDAWDGTVAPESRGGVLFETWWRRYASQMRDADSPYREPWTAEQPTETPSGIADPATAVEAFARAVEETAVRFGAFDVAWGDVHRVRRGAVDVPVGGCSGSLGCFRVLGYREDEDGKRVANSGDGWVLAVEFTNPPRAFSVLAYGQSPNEESPYHADQAAMFAAGRMKPVAFTEKQIAEQLVVRYRPGEERASGR